ACCSSAPRRRRKRRLPTPLSSAAARTCTTPARPASSSSSPRKAWPKASAASPASPAAAPCRRCRGPACSSEGLTGMLNCKPEEVRTRVEGLLDEVKKLQGQLKKGAAGDLNSAGDTLLAQAADIGGAKVIVGEIPAAPKEQIRGQLDRLRQKAKS